MLDYAKSVLGAATTPWCRIGGGRSGREPCMTIIGMDLGATKLAAAIFSEQGEIL